jgi:hypothetical protein
MGLETDKAELRLSPFPGEGALCAQFCIGIPSPSYAEPAATRTGTRTSRNASNKNELIEMKVIDLSHPDAHPIRD